MINFVVALKNTLVPVITITGLQLGAIIAFAIITESVFQWPGMGLMFMQAVQQCRHSDHGRLPGADRVRVRGRST
jgi:ABC-type dipeptide/oligopeptide/nickel transport system permease component